MWFPQRLLLLVITLTTFEEKNVKVAKNVLRPLKKFENQNVTGM